jgi:hypothetical protein
VHDAKVLEMMQWLARIGWTAWLSTALFVSAPSVAWSQSVQTPDPKALALFNEGKALMEEGKHVAACAKFEESLKVQRGIGTLYNLSDCLEKLGRTASASQGFQEAAEKAEAAGQSERAKAARKRIEELAPKLSKLRIEVANDSMAGLQVTRDGLDIDKKLWGADVPIDPGNYRISASAPGKIVWSTIVVIKEPGGVAVVRVPELKRAPVAGGGFDHKSGWNTVIIESGIVVSTTALATAIGFTIAANKSAHDADVLLGELKPKGFCPEIDLDKCAELVSINRDRDLFTNTAIPTYVTAGVAATATAIYTLWPSSKSKAGQTVTVLPVPVITGRQGGLWLGGTF